MMQATFMLLIMLKEYRVDTNLRAGLDIFQLKTMGKQMLVVNVCQTPSHAVPTGTWLRPIYCKEMVYKIGQMLALGIL